MTNLIVQLINLTACIVYKTVVRLSLCAQKCDVANVYEMSFNGVNMHATLIKVTPL